MLVKVSLYLAVLFIIFVSFYLLFHSIKTDNKSESKQIIWTNMIYILYCSMIPYIFEYYEIFIGFEFILFYPIYGITVLVSIISIILCLRKFRKNISTIDINYGSFATIILIFLPLVLVSYSIIRQKIIINDSEVVIYLHSVGNGGIGDGNGFGYAINGKSCKSIDLGTDSTFTTRVISDIFEEEDDNTNNNNYRVELLQYEDDVINIYKEEKLISKCYFSGANVSLRKVYYRK